MEFYEIIGKLLAALLVGMVAYLTPKIQEWLKANTNAAISEDVQRLVNGLCAGGGTAIPRHRPKGHSPKAVC